MAKYIERKALRDALYDADTITMQGVKLLNQLPDADVVPVRHAHWEEWLPGMSVILTGEEMLYMCSNCTAKYEDVEGMRYCPNCEAKMDEEVAE